MQESGINKRILTWGEAGVGKTTFCFKLAQDWAETVKERENPESTKLTEEQRHLLSNIGLVLYIVFRDTHANQSLDDIVQSHIFKAIGEENKCINVSEQKYHKDILLVCDGLDEVSYEESELLEIIAGRMYPNVRCIVTCRPHASLGMSLTADAEIRLKGFSKQQARHYVDMYFRQKYPPNRNLAEQKSIKLWNDIESSPDLLEMSINPSMLQLLCKMFLATGKIAKDRATVFKDYTYFLLQQNHIKLHTKPVGHTELKNMYKGIILKAGHLALQGLKQTHLQLMFTKESVIELAGKEMFDIGFVTEVPGHRFEKSKAQFQHKTHQEYLAAYFIVESADGVGIKYLMEFCSTSKGLMGSQIILTFITAMSKRMGKVIQKKIIDLVSSWESEDDISPKDRTSFLLTMLKENKSLSFPLPKEIDINIREYEKSSDWFQKVLQKFGKKSALETFFTFDNRGVEKITLVLGKEHRLELLKNFKNSQLQEVSLNFQRKCVEKDQLHLSGLIQRNEKVKFLSLEKLLVQDLVSICRNSEFISCLVKSDNLKTIRLSKCETAMNTELADAFKHFPSHVELDISGNRVTNQFVCIALMQNAAHLASLIMQDCGIIIDADIADAISQLPEQVNLDLSGNTITKMGSSLPCHVISVISNKKIDLSGLGIEICTEIAEAVSRLPDHTELDLSGNQVMDESACITLIQKAYKMKFLKIYNCMSNCGIQIDKEIAEAVSRLPDHTELDLSGNHVTDKSACIILLHKAATMRFINIHNCMSNCFIQIDIEIAKAVSRLHDHTELDLSGNHVTDKSASITLIQKAASMKSLNICSCGIQIDTEIAEAVSSLPDHTQLDLSGNQVTDKAVCITLIHKAASMKSLSMSNCGIKIDTEIADVVSKLPDHTQLDLSGNEMSNIKPDLLPRVLTYMKKQEIINIKRWGITVDVKIVRAMSKLTKLKGINIIFPKGKLTSQAAAEFSHTVSCMPHLQVLNLVGCDISKDAAVALTYNLSKKCPQLEILSLSNNNLSSIMEEAVEHIQQMKNLKELYLSNCGVAVALTDNLFKHCSQLKVVNLSNSNLSAGMQESVKPLQMMKNLEKLFLSNCGISNDIIVALTDSLSKHCNQLKILNLSNNNLSDGMETVLKHIQQMKKVEKLFLANCGTQIDTEIADAVSRLPDHTQLNLSGNQVTDKSACVTLIHKAATMKSLSICNCGIQIDTEIAEAVSRLPDHTKLDLSGNQVTDKSAGITLIHKAATMKSINIYNCICNCGIHIDIEMAEAVSRLPDHTQLDLSGNQVTDKSAGIALIHKAATMKSLSICNCGIQIDAEIAEAVPILPDHTQLDLSNNEMLNMKPDLLSRVLFYMKKQEIIDMERWEITIDVFIVKAMSKLSKLKGINILFPKGKLTPPAAAEFAHTVSSLPHLLSFNLVGCDISNDAAVTLTYSLSKHCPLLQNLSLSDNNLSSCMEEMVKHMQRMKNLKQLFLSNCDISGDVIVTMMDSLSKHSPLLQALSLSNNNLSSGMKKSIKHIKQMKNVVKLFLANCGIQIDTKIAKAVSRLPDHTHLDLSGNRVIDKSACIRLIHKAATMKSLNIHNCMSNSGMQIDAEIAEAVSRLPDHTELDLYGNQVTDKYACITLINKAATMKSLNIHNCVYNSGMHIDAEIAEAVSRLPDHTQLDLSGNQVTDKSAGIALIHKAATMKSLSICNCGIQIDTEIAKALSRLPDDTQLDLSGNKITDKSACNTLIHKAATMKSLSISKCGTQIDTEIAEALTRLPDHAQLDLSGNQVTDKSACITLIHKAATMTSLSINSCLSYCNIQIDREIAEAVSMLPDHTELDLSGIKVTDKSASITLIHKAATMKSLSLCNCGIQIDTEIAEAVTRLPDHTKLNLSGNQVTDKSACITLIQKAATMKYLSLCNCGIQIDTEIAEAVTRLPDHTKLDLSGNQVTDKSACITLLHKAAAMKSFSLCNCGIQIDTEAAEAISQLPEQADLDLSGNTVTKMDSSLLCHVIPVISNKKIDLSGLGVIIDDKVTQTLSSLKKGVEIDLSGNKFPHKCASITLLQKAATMTSLSICNCGITIDTEIAEAISQLPEQANLDLSGNTVTKMDSSLLCHVIPVISSKKIDLSGLGVVIDDKLAIALYFLKKQIKLDLSGNQILDKSVCVKLIHIASTMKSLRMRFCGIIIDTEVAEAISQLPEHANLDLSGNTVTKMDSSLLCHVIPVIRHKSMDLTGLGVVIDAEVSKAICTLDEDVNVDMSDNVIAQMDYQLLCHLLYRLYRKTVVEINTNRRVIKYNLLQVIHMKRTDTHFDISSNNAVIQDIILSLIITAVKWKPLFQQDNKKVMTNDAMTILSQHLQGHVQLEINDIYLPQMQNPILPIVTACMTDQGKVDLSQIIFQEDENTDNALLHLPKNVQLDLSNHRIANNSTSEKMIKKQVL